VRKACSCSCSLAMHRVRCGVVPRRPK